MRKTNALRWVGTDHLTVIHKATPGKEVSVKDHAVIQTDLSFTITGWNAFAEELSGKPGAMGQHLFDFADIRFIDGNKEQIISSLRERGTWTGEVLFRRYDGQQFYLRVTATHIFNKKKEPVALTIASHLINEIKLNEERLQAAETKLEALINTLPDGVMMIGADGRIATSSKRGLEIMGLTEEQVLGRPAACASWNAVRPDGTPFPVNRFPAVVSLQTGLPQRNVIMGFEKPSGEPVWLSFNSEALIKSPGKDPYAVIVSFSDITNFIMTEKELLRSNERLHYVTGITSDSIWDYDMIKNEIYRSETFNRLSGYAPAETGSNLQWWFSRIHPDDRERVKQKLNRQLRVKKERWEDEYRFAYADGSYKVLRDSAMVFYQNGKAVRILGAIRDITEETKLKKQLEEEEEQKSRAVALAALKAEEREKAKISRELHDNVNQVLMCAKLYMESARQTPVQATGLLDKAIEYQLLALHEIRKLSRELSAPGITTAGLQDSIGDIVKNLEGLQHMNVVFEFDPAIERLLSNEEKLTLYRVVQEQSSNIMKYAEATEVKIRVGTADRQARLTISDNGKGFCRNRTKSVRGIGMINMQNRAKARRGTFSIESSPGNGCKIEFSFPIIG